MGKNIIINEEQLKLFLKKLKENQETETNAMSKQQLFTIATLAYKMWEMLEEEDSKLEDWMESKIAQSEAAIISVVKSFMYNETTDDLKGMDTLDYDSIVIGN